jgi:hypothetical protein
VWPLLTVHCSSSLCAGRQAGSLSIWQLRYCGMTAATGVQAGWQSLHAVGSMHVVDWFLSRRQAAGIADSQAAMCPCEACNACAHTPAAACISTWQWRGAAALSAPHSAQHCSPSTALHQHTPPVSQCHFMHCNMVVDRHGYTFSTALSLSNCSPITAPSTTTL